MSSSIKVVAKLENQFDVTRCQLGVLALKDIRTIEIQSALVDCNESHLYLSPAIIARLELPQHLRHVRVAHRVVTRRSFGPVQLTVCGRSCVYDALQSEDIESVVIGSIALLDLDLVIDFVNQRLIGNPAHDGERMSEEYLLKASRC